MTNPTLRSPRFHDSITAGALTAAGTWYKNYAQDYLTGNETPFNNIVVRNFSSQRLKCEYGDTVFIIGAQETFADNQAYGLNTLKITNLDAINANDDLIFIQVYRIVSGDDALIAEATGQNLFAVANGNGGMN